MDLLNENNNKKNKKTTGQKVVLTALIVSVILFIGILVLLLTLSKQATAIKYTIAINGEKFYVEDLEILSLENGKSYIALRNIANKLNYKYYNGEFGMASEDKSKGYIDNGDYIIQFFANSPKIYKVEEELDIDYQYYNIQNEILEQNGNLYISLEDLQLAFNLIVNYSAELNQTTIQTAENWLAEQSAFFTNNNYTVNEEKENLRALSYGYVIVTKDEKVGVINLQGQEIIGNKYNSIKFEEYTQNFIVSNVQKKFGIITKESETIINMQYEEIEVLNYNPLLYKVKKINEYGVLNAKGEVLNEIKYDSIGYPKNNEKGINYTLIVPEIAGYLSKAIVVCEKGKYGLIDLENGTEIIAPSLNAIYSVTYEGEDYIVVERDNVNKDFLEDYVKSLNSLTGNVNS